MRNRAARTKLSGLIVCSLVLLVTIGACGDNSTPIAGNIIGESATTTAGVVATATGMVAQAAATETPAPIPTVNPNAAPAITTAPAEGSQSGGSQTVPNYPNFRIATLGLPLEQRLTGLPVGSTKPANVYFFTTNSSFEDVTAYYDKQLSGIGYTKAGRQNLASLGGIKLNGGLATGYTKGGTNSKQITLVNAGIITQNFFAQLSTAELNAVKLNLGDRLVILFDNVPLGLG